MFRSTLQLFVAVALFVQLAGCIFMDRGRHGHSSRSDHHQGHEHGSSIDVHLRN